MENIKSFEEFIGESQEVKEDVVNEMTLFRLVPLKGKDKLDVNSPGNHYVNKESQLDKKLLDSPSGDLIKLTVKTADKNIESSDEAPGVSVVKNDSQVELVSAVPFKS